MGVPDWAKVKKNIQTFMAFKNLRRFPRVFLVGNFPSLATLKYDAVGRPRFNYYLQKQLIKYLIVMNIICCENCTRSLFS